jgi:hypothetical protein
MAKPGFPAVIQRLEDFDRAINEQVVCTEKMILKELQDNRKGFLHAIATELTPNKDMLVWFIYVRNRDVIASLFYEGNISSIEYYLSRTDEWAAWARRNCKGNVYINQGFEKSFLIAFNINIHKFMRCFRTRPVNIIYI